MESAAGALPAGAGTGPGTGRRDPDRVHVAGVVVRICFLIGAIVVFNAFPQWIGTYRSLDDPSSFVPLLAPEFQQKSAHDKVFERDRAAAAYLKRFYDIDWANSSLYHLVIDTKKWGIEPAAHLVAQAVECLPQQESLSQAA